MLQGRVGVVCLVVGFALQLAGLALPSGSGASWLSVPVAAGAVVFARAAGNRWIRRHRQSLLDEVFRSHRINVVIEDIDALRRSPRRSPPWTESRLVLLLERFVDRP